MSRGWRLGPRAEARLDEIADWTFDRFGPRQARDYQAKLHDAFDRLADGTLRGRSARSEWGPEVREGLMFLRVERHVVLYVERPEGTVVVDVLHEAMDVGRWVRG